MHHFVRAVFPRVVGASPLWNRASSRNICESPERFLRRCSTALEEYEKYQKYPF
jgi:hypothetical protein